MLGFIVKIGIQLLLPIKHDKNQAKETIPAQQHCHPLQVTTQPREELVSVSHLPNARKPKKSSYLFIHFFGQKASYLSCSFIGTLHTSPQGHTTYIVST